MILDMKRVAGLVTLLGLACTAASRPALAQDAAGNTWFDGAASDGPEQAARPPAPDSAPQQAPPTGPDDSALMDPNQPPSAPPLEAPGDASVMQGPQAAPGAQEATPEQDTTPETDPRAMTEFRSALDPYGAWVDDQKYGTVWVPNRDAVGDDFAPYVSAGHWALSEDNDWVWQSDYPFGDVVFHYGRWVWIPGTGWSWVAGRRYANAWVSWRVPTDDYGYVGWAPMPPAWGWYGGSAVSLWWAPPAAYVFCPSLYAFSPHVHSYIVHDQYVIHDVAAHTRNYSSVGVGGRGGVQRSAASPRALPANSVAPRGPSLQSVHVPASMTPASRLPSRMAFAGTSVGGAATYRGSNAYFRAASPRPRTAYQSSQYQAARTWSPSLYRAAPTYGAPGAAQRSAYTVPSSGYLSRARTTWSAPSAQRAYAPPATSHYSAPSYSAPTSHYSAPSYSAPTSHYSAPSYSAPTSHYSAPSYSAPTSHYSAPSSHSSPSFHSSSRR